jgi:hypothetical protein
MEGHEDSSQPMLSNYLPLGVSAIMANPPETINGDMITPSAFVLSFRDPPVIHLLREVPLEVCCEWGDVFVFEEINQPFKVDGEPMVRRERFFQFPWVCLQEKHWLSSEWRDIHESRERKRERERKIVEHSPPTLDSLQWTRKMRGKWVVIRWMKDDQWRREDIDQHNQEDTTMMMAEEHRTFFYCISAIIMDHWSSLPILQVHHSSFNDAPFNNPLHRIVQMTDTFGMDDANDEEEQLMLYEIPPLSWRWSWDIVWMNGFFVWDLELCCLTSSCIFFQWETWSTYHWW